LRRAASLPLLVAGQFLGTLGDSALLIVAVQALARARAPAWEAPLLRILFYGAYVLLAVVAGAVADAFAKRDVLVVTSLVKVLGCSVLAAGGSPLAAYTLVGLGAVPHMPARYGILGEFVAPSRLVAANAWLEASTLCASILGIGAGGALVASGERHPALAGMAQRPAWWLDAAFVGAAVCSSLLLRAPAVRPGGWRRVPGAALRFRRAAMSLWSCAQTRGALTLTSTLWGVAAVLQLEVLRWTTQRLQLPLSSAAWLQLAVAAGMVCGAAAAGRWTTLARERTAALAALGGGATLSLLAFATGLATALPLLGAVGVFAGWALVASNARVQAGGKRAGGPGEWLAVQHFIENAMSLALLAVYGLAILCGLSSSPVILAMGCGVALSALASLC